MIQLFEKDATSFERMGIAVLKPVSCVVHEEKNGDFSLEMVVAEDDELCREERIVFAPTPKNGNQPFRIYDVERQIGVEKRIKARHVFYDLLDNFLEDVRPTGNGAFALQRLLNETQYPSGFTGTSDIETSATAYWEMKNPVEALIGTDENSFVNRWGGVADRDKFTVTMRKNGGRENAVRIRYGKNLESCGLHCNYENIVTRIMPTGLKADGQTLLKLPEKYVDSEHLNDYNAPKVLRVHYSNIKVGENEGDYKTETEACAALRAAAKAEFENGADLPEITGSISVVDLRQTREYEAVKALETIYPFDTLEVELSADNGTMSLVSVNMQAYDYDCTTERYTKITIGEQNYVGDLVKTVLKKVSDTLSEEGIASLPDRVQKATELITTALGGYVVKRENELLIMDTKDPKTASRVWRWNLNGLGYSKTGYDGPYALAMTMDGQINADFITVGTLSANLIKGGILMSKNGASWINMDNGTFCFQAVKEAWMDTDTGEMSYEYEKVLELVDKVLKIYGRLGNLQYPNFYVQIGPNKEKSNGALTCFQDGTAFFRVSKNNDGCAIENGDGTDGAASIGLDKDGVAMSYMKPGGIFGYLKLTNELYVNTKQVWIRTINDTLSISNNRFPYMWINWNAAPSGYQTQSYRFGNGTEGGYAAVYASDFVTASDPDLKENIKKVSDFSALSKIKELLFYSYDFKKTDKEERHCSLGIMAPEAPEEIQSDDRKAIKMYEYTNLIAKSVQELIEKYDEQEKRIAVLETELQTLKNKKSAQ